MVCDKVLVKEHDLPRSSWQLAWVDQVWTDEDDLVWKARIAVDINDLGIAVGTNYLDNKGRRKPCISYLDSQSYFT